MSFCNTAAAAKPRATQPFLKQSLEKKLKPSKNGFKSRLSAFASPLGDACRGADLQRSAVFHRAIQTNVFVKSCRLCQRITPRLARVEPRYGLGFCLLPSALHSFLKYSKYSCKFVASPNEKMQKHKLCDLPFRKITDISKSQNAVILTYYKR